MANKGICEYDAKLMLADDIENHTHLHITHKVVRVDPENSLDQLVKKNGWLKRDKLVVKPDQLFGKRGKNNLLLLDADFDQAKKFIREKMNKEFEVGKIRGKLTHFLVEPFVAHDHEYYIAIKSERENDVIYFSERGGVDIEENWDHVVQIDVPLMEGFNRAEADKKLPKAIEFRDNMLTFIEELYHFYASSGFSYLEINPMTFTEQGKIIPLDLVAKVDDTAHFENRERWSKVQFMTPFGSTSTKEEQLIKEMDEKTGSSLKFTMLNPSGSIWTLVAGGGASVVYTDTIVDLGFGKDLANYGEYSGNPNTEETYNYTKTILDLMTRDGRKGKVLLIGGGIANFTDVAKTFTGIIQALKEFGPKLRKNKVKIYVRRGGPNYKEGLDKMRKLGEDISVPIQVYGPETHMTKIVSMALKK